MEPKIMRQKEMKTVFGKRNYVILSIGSILVIIGYILSLVLGVVDILMSGKGSTLAAYNPDIFSDLRIRVAPVICLIGYLLNGFGIIYHPKQDHSKLSQ